MNPKRPLRILQVVGGLNRGGTETWLMNVLHYLDRDRFQMDFLTHTAQAGAYDEEVQAWGSRVIPCLYPARPLRYAGSFRGILRKDGPYDIVHSHVHHFTGYVLRLAHKAGVQVRIAHSHSDTAHADGQASPLRRLYLRLMERWIARHATAGAAASRKAAVALFGSAWEADLRWQVLHCGIDLTPFRGEVDRCAARAEVGLPPDAFVIGHVGRLEEVKNHRFLLDIAEQVVRRIPETYLLLLGEGRLRAELQEKARLLGLGNRTIFTGARSDVARLMLGCMDVFVFPSHYEGLPLVLVEAQAAGLPCICSDTITEEAQIIPELVTRLSLKAPVGRWVDEVVRKLQGREQRHPLQCTEIVERSSFNVKCSADALGQLYLGLMQHPEELIGMKSCPS